MAFSDPELQGTVMSAVHPVMLRIAASLVPILRDNPDDGRDLIAAIEKDVHDTLALAYFEATGQPLVITTEGDTNP